MHKHILTLGLISASLCVMTAMAAWTGPQITTTQDLYTTTALTTKPKEHCLDCCHKTCWLPTGTYYSSTGTRTIECGAEPTTNITEASCFTLNVNDNCYEGYEDGTESAYIGYCMAAGQAPRASGINVLNVPSLSSCTGVGTGSTQMMWGVQFPYGKVIGIASCYGDTSNPAPGGTLPTDPGNGVGFHCVCKMTKVAGFDVTSNSKWSLVKSYYDTAGDDNTRQYNCANDCAAQCAQAVRTNDNDFRKTLYGNYQK